MIKKVISITAAATMVLTVALPSFAAPARERRDIRFADEVVSAQPAESQGTSFQNLKNLSNAISIAPAEAFDSVESFIEWAKQNEDKLNGLSFTNEGGGQVGFQVETSLDTLDETLFNAAGLQMLDSLQALKNVFENYLNVDEFFNALEEAYQNGSSELSDYAKYKEALTSVQKTINNMVSPQDFMGKFNIAMGLYVLNPYIG